MKSWIICYDIEDNRERNRIYKLLLKYGQAVQKSVFEVSFPERKLSKQQQLFEQLKEIASDEANIRFYSISQTGIQQSWTLGEPGILQRPGAIIL
jgi:CRISPR-associated protein Cas2